MGKLCKDGMLGSAEITLGVLCIKKELRCEMRCGKVRCGASVKNVVQRLLSHVLIVQICIIGV